MKSGFWVLNSPPIDSHGLNLTKWLADMMKAAGFSAGFCPLLDLFGSCRSPSWNSSSRRLWSWTMPTFSIHHLFSFSYACGLRLEAVECILARGSRLLSNAFNVHCYWSGKREAGISYDVLSIISGNCTSCLPICSCLNGPETLTFLWHCWTVLANGAVCLMLYVIFFFFVLWTSVLKNCLSTNRSIYLLRFF